MTTLVLPFLIGIGMGGMTVWILMSLTTATTNPTHTATQRHEGWTVRSIVDRLEQERLEASPSDHIGSQLRCG